MTARIYFITGTDTDVGKTVVTAALLCAMQAEGRRAIAAKPVQTGARDGADDLGWCWSFSRIAFSEEDRRDAAPYRFDLPASPHLAAARAGIGIDLERIVEGINRLAARFDVVLVEGAGGLLVPLNDRHTMLDLALALSSTPFVVGRNALGTLNHTSLTVAELDRHRHPPAAVVLNHATPIAQTDDAIIRADNIDTLSRRLHPIPVIDFPHHLHITRETLTAAGRLIINRWAIGDRR